MEKEFGLVENPIDKKLKEIIEGKSKRKVTERPRGKVVSFNNFRKEFDNDDTNFSDPDIIDVEIL